MDDGHGRARHLPLQAGQALNRLKDEIQAAIEARKTGFEDAALPDFGPVPGGTYDPATLWWAHERLHRAVLEDYAPRLAAFASRRDRLEAGFIKRVEALIARGGSAAEAGALSQAIWKEAAEAERGWLKDVLAVRPRPARRPSHLYRMHWRKLARQARMRP